MGLKKGRPSKALKGVKQIVEGVVDREQKGTHEKSKRKTTHDLNERRAEDLGEHKQAKSYSTIKLTGSTGKVYEVTVPSSYLSNIPRTWKWTEERYRVAELIAQGIPFSQIPDDPQVNFKSRMVIYCWLEHPEFKEHVDGLIMETGWASRRERLMNLQRLNQQLLNKVLREMDAMKLTDKNVGAILNAIQAGAKLIAQEKGEFVEESKVTQDTNLTGTVTSVTAKLDDFVKSRTAEEQKELEKEFDNMGDDIIRALTGSKD